MRGFLAVASREIRQRRSVFAAAAVAAILPFLAPLLPAVKHDSAAEVRFYVAAFLAFAFAAGLSLILGTTAIGSDLSQRRLGFYFSRPIGASAIWAGKIAAAWLVVVLVTAIVFAPAALAQASLWRSEAGSGFGLFAAAFAASVLVFLALGNVVSMSLRSRSAWVAADLVAFALWIALMVSIGFPLAAAQATALLQGLGVAVAAASAAALLAAGGAQVSIGRLDTACGNRARFAALWGGLFLVAALAFGYVRWLLSPSPADLVFASVQAASSGSWIAVNGAARRRSGLAASLFYDISSGRSLLAHAGRGSAMVISKDGSTAVWTEPSSIWADGPQDVWMCRLGNEKLARVSTGISARLWRIELSADGSTLAAVGSGSIGVYQLATGRLLAAIPQVSDERFTRVAFLHPDRLRLYRIPSAGSAPSREALASIEIFDFDVPGKRLTPTSTIANIRRPFSLTFDDEGGRVIAWERGNSLSLFDAATGRLVAVLANARWEAASRAFLSDGTIAIGEASGGTGRVHLFSREGEPGKVFETGPAGIVRLGGEPVKGALAIASGPASGSEPSPRSALDASVLDLETGAIRSIGRHMEPVAARLRWNYSQPAAGSVASLLFSRSDGALLRIDPATGTLKTILGR